MRIIAAALLLTAFIAGPAFAQADHVPKYREEVEKSPADEANEQRQQRAYQRALNAVPNQKPVDPWGMARPNDGQGTPKANVAKTKPAKPTSAAAK
ncbi:MULTISPECIES: hypothetical protein [Bradyrhizobium]|jgi:hypothetical protein|uniref:hypothetical protein n=1 Tax=Bradyrhizobium TaxID=374 RepID=UPI00041B4F89|nr:MULTISPECIES: hypothetical protein [Bradyrhizobium]KIU42984.1 hypothetical protein QU41_33020 [Bradyrhizobium elkanii]MBK5656311.1 hypothetical protein [Rhizobium sp.]OCX31122.1 hypothetical protein QU42_10230 [Bradyrhizobium sp. UASWS1016]